MLFASALCAFMLGLLLGVPDQSQAEDFLQHLRVMALAPASQQAVVRWPDGRMLLLRVGEDLGTPNVRVLQILPDRLVLEEVITSVNQSPTRQQVWLYRAPRAGGASQLVRLHRSLPASEQPVRTGYQAVSRPE